MPLILFFVSQTIKAEHKYNVAQYLGIKRMGIGGKN